VRLGLHGQVPTRLALALRYLYAILLRPEYLSQKLDRPLPTKDSGNRAHDIASVVQASQCCDEIGVGFLFAVCHRSPLSPATSNAAVVKQSAYATRHGLCM
jgi:hypothetical protein